LGKVRLGLGLGTTALATVDLPAPERPRRPTRCAGSMTSEKAGTVGAHGGGE